MTNNETVRCARHPDVETALRCGKCDTPICPRCMVDTPVGARCPKCARLRKLPTFQVTNRHLLIAAGAGLGVAVVYGLLWGVLGSLINFFFLNLLLAAGAGYTIGEVTSRSVNRKRGPKLAVIAGFAVAVSYLISILFTWGFPLVSFTVTRLLLGLVALGLGIYVATTRIR